MHFHPNFVYVGGHSSFNTFVKITICTNWGVSSLPATIFVTLKIDAEFIETSTNDCSELVVGLNRFEPLGGSIRPAGQTTASQIEFEFCFKSRLNNYRTFFVKYNK